jgi:hypothetical protein
LFDYVFLDKKSNMLRNVLRDSDSGQALLIVLLTMTVVLTVVLSVVSKTVTDISVTTYEEDAQRAFDAAEAGIERVLLSGTSQSEPLGEAEFTANISSPLPSSDQVVYPSDVLAGESATFWFVSHDDSGDLVCVDDCLRANSFNVCWGKPGPVDQYTPAIEISLYYDTSLGAISSGDYSGVKIARFAYDPVASRTTNNNFYVTSSGCSGGLAGHNLAFSTGTIQLNNDTLPNFDLSCPPIDVGCLIMAKVRFLYNHNPATDESYPHPVGIEVNPQGGTHLPAQGTQIDSVGTSGDTTRKVNVFQGYPEPPFVFESALFGQGGLSKP